jgi:Flp pilus assembly protein TadG
MMPPPRRPQPARRRRGGRAGSTTLEFALIASTLLIICLGSINLGALLWTQEVMELAAADTARCVALGSSLCANPQTYAIGIAQQYSFNGVLPIVGSVNPVWSHTNATCSSTSGNVTPGTNTVVTITSTYWSGTLSIFESLGMTLGTKVLTATACYPS